MTLEEIEALFSGAPHFGTEMLGGLRQAQVVFPWDKDIIIRDSTDCTLPPHPAFSVATLRSHLVPTSLKDSQSSSSTIEYDIGATEVPCMLRAQGAEPGTVGFEYFMALSNSDNLRNGLDDDAGKSGLSEKSRNLELLQSNPERLGIRYIDTTMIYERLEELTDLYYSFKEDEKQVNILEAQSSGELYANLFGKFLTPPRFDSDAEDPTGVKVQIKTLFKILKINGIWIDFSLVEWRIRLGQVLWTADDFPVDESEHSGYGQPPWTEREMLLLQITLACELLIRLDTISGMTTSQVKEDVHLNNDDVKEFNEQKTRKIDWDLILARRFLDNVKAHEEIVEPPEQPKRGFLSSLANEPEPSPPSAQSSLLLLPRHQTRQVSGLLNFANEIGWPNVENVMSSLSQKLRITEISPDHTTLGGSQSHMTIPSPSVYGTPLGTPRSIRSSYFGNINSKPVRPSLSRGTSQMSVTLQPSTPEIGTASFVTSGTSSVGGWLSLSYLTGLILPGESLSHLTISTLLENDSDAVAELGDEASLYGGFVYQACSWWSKNCIVGRVLGVLGTECNGWVAVPYVPRGWRESSGWIDVSTQDAPTTKIMDEEGAVERGGSFILGNTEFDTINPKELRIPASKNTKPTADIRFLELHLDAYPSEDAKELDSSAESIAGTGKSALKTPRKYSASLTFALTPIHDDGHPAALTPEGADSSSTENINHDLDDSGDAATSLDLTVHLRYDVHFITSYPCTPPPLSRMRVVTRPDGTDMSSSESTATPLSSHPLHESHTFTLVELPSLFDEGFTAPALEDREVLVLDSRSGKPAELLSRAWCAERAMHAIVARTGRTCLSCAIREARASGVSIVIWI